VRVDCRRDQSGRDICNEVWSERTVEVPIHRLTYDFGRNRFVNYLLFEFGTLVRVDSGSYGVKAWCERGSVDGRTDGRPPCVCLSAGDEPGRVLTCDQTFGAGAAYW